MITQNCILTLYSSYPYEMLPQQGKQTAALEISSCFLLWLWKIFRGACHSKYRIWGCCHFAVFYIFSAITCCAWTGGSGTIVPPYLRGQLGGTSQHRRILILSVNATHCWPFSHTDLYLGCSRGKNIGTPCIRADNNVRFPFYEWKWFHREYLAYKWWVTM